MSTVLANTCCRAHVDSCTLMDVDTCIDAGACTDANSCIDAEACIDADARTYAHRNALLLLLLTVSYTLTSMRSLAGSYNSGIQGSLWSGSLSGPCLQPSRHFSRSQ
ncbi:hypothetical protein BDR06DRAFT_950897 [Suillus hirtellus]|nr:hypothetical protein BDR06DRAFT_950897 [Suillus hirtellus]